MANNITKRELINELRRLNPSANIEGWFVKGSIEYIYSSIPVEELILPSPFYYNDKNGINNKHKTKTGMYISLQVISE